MKGICFCPQTWARIKTILNKSKSGKAVIRIINAAQSNRKPATKKRKTNKNKSVRVRKSSKSRDGRNTKFPSPAQMRVRNNMKRAAKKCKGLKGAKHKACMKRELRKKR